MNIFLSYASEDREIAETIAHAISGQGKRVFFDRNELPSGNEYIRRIQKAIFRSNLFIFLISPDSIKSDAYTRTELSIAQKKWPNPNGCVLPVLIKPTDTDSVPSYVKSITHLIPEGNPVAATALEVNRLCGALSKRPATAFILGLASGFITLAVGIIIGSILFETNLNTTIIKSMPIDREILLQAMPIDLTLLSSSLVFSGTIIGYVTYCFGFRITYLLIILLVVIGWFVSILIVDNTSFNSHITQAVPKICDNMVVSWRYPDYSKPEWALTELEDCARYWWSRFDEIHRAWRDMFAWASAGGVGAFIVAAGIPLATGRAFSLRSKLCTAGAGALVAGAWFAIFWMMIPDPTWSPPEIYTTLLIAWQPVTMVTIAYFLE